MMNHKAAQTMPNEIGVDHLFEIFLRKWPMIIALGLLGALGGFLISAIKAPIYEAETTLGVSISYAMTEPLDLVVEDRVFDRVAGLMGSDSTLGKVLERIPSADREMRAWEGAADLRQALRLDRRLSEWGLVAIDSDPEFAAQVSRIWAEESLLVLGRALGHAWTVAEMVSTESRKAFAPQQKVEVNWQNRKIWECQIVPFDIDPELWKGDLNDELVKSRGLFPSLVIELFRESTPPDRPVLWGRGSLVLAGGLTGFMAGLLLLLFQARRETGATSDKQGAGE